MGDTIQFDYYYGIEAEQFSFYRVPRLLMTMIVRFVQRIIKPVLIKSRMLSFR